MDCQQELAAGRVAFAGRDFTAATLHFGRAHGACHDDKPLHLAAHWGMARTAISRGHLKMAFTQWGLGVLAWIFD